MMLVGAIAVMVAWVHAGARTARPSDRPIAVDAAVININSASAAEMTLLPGIGPRAAEKIVRDREARGPYASVDDLRRVDGIGAVTVERIRRAGASAE
jgi:competence protein ComEA